MMVMLMMTVIILIVIYFSFLCFIAVRQLFAVRVILVPRTLQSVMLQLCSVNDLMMLICTGSVSSVSLLSTESIATAVSLPSVSRSVMSSPYTVLTTGKPSDHAFVQLQPQPAHQVAMLIG